MALDPAAARTRRARQGPSAHRLSDRASARRAFRRACSAANCTIPRSESTSITFSRSASTNAIAFERGDAGEPHGTVVIAEEQTAGRGRAGRAWHSEKTNGIYVTVLLRPAMSPMLAPLITMVAGLAVRDAVLEETGLAPDLRWPNDLLMAGKKFCGILTEMHAEPDRVHFVVVGIGIDVNHAAMPAELASIATSLAHGDRTNAFAPANCRAVAAHLETYYNRFLAEGPAPILARFTEVSSYARGKRVRITTASETYTGTTDGLEPERPAARAPRRWPDAMW